jgi:hypothetical protein
VVLVVGQTGTLPERPTTPTPLLILTDVAFDTLQLNIVESPAYILEGLAVK